VCHKLTLFCVYQSADTVLFNFPRLFLLNKITNVQHNELLKGEIKVELDPLDIEQSLLKQKLIKRIKFGELPSLVELTDIAHRVGLSDLEVLIQEVLLKSGKKIDYAVITGVQVHTTNCDFITPDEKGGCYVVVDGKRSEIAFPNIENEFYKQVLAKQQQKKLERQKHQQQQQQPAHK